MSRVGRKVTTVRKYRTRRTGARRVVSVIAMLLVVAGLALIGYALLGGNSPLKIGGSDELPASVTDTNLKLTVPKMARVENLNVYDGPADDESALEAGALHVQGTGFPWQQESNVYIAGHRLGYLGTDSYLVFYDLDKLEQGDEVILSDANDTRYTYRVFRNFVVAPTDWQIAEPIPSKSVVSLQTCTLPDYSQRIIVQAELVEVA
jgi:sortase A